MCQKLLQKQFLAQDCIKNIYFANAICIQCFPVTKVSRGFWHYHNNHIKNGAIYIKCKLLSNIPKGSTTFRISNRSRVGNFFGRMKVRIKWRIYLFHPNEWFSFFYGYLGIVWELHRETGNGLFLLCHPQSLVHNTST